MSYSHSVDAMNGDMPIKEHWYRCDITGEMISEAWPRIHIEGTDVDISHGAVQEVILPWFIKCAPVPFEWVVADMKMRAGIDDPRRPGLPAHIRKEVIASAGGKCAKCGATERVHVDHIVPVALGGTDARKNLQALCQPCNNKKGIKSNECFMAQ